MSRFINNFSLRSTLNLLQSVSKMLKSSKFMAQLHQNRWSDLVDCFKFLRRFLFSCKIADSHVFSFSDIIVVEGFHIIINLAVTTRITINYSRANFFSSGSLNWNSVLSLNLDIKIAISLQYGKSLSIVCFSFVLKKNDSLPKYVNGTMLRWTIERDLPYCKLKVLFRSKCRLNTLFQFKLKFTWEKNSLWVNYKVTYFGKIFHHFYNTACTDLHSYRKAPQKR